jgi:LacI family transcriptional regulator
MSTVIAGIEKVTNEAGFNLIISQSSESVQKEILSAKTMFNNRVDGLLVSLAYDTVDTSHFELFARKNIPFLFFDRVATDNRWTNVLIDNRKAGYEATAHLASMGCRRIVHITADSRSNVYKDRLAGYRDALEDHGLPYNERYVLRNNLTQDAGAEAAALLRAMDPLPDGVFVSNDNCAVGCLLALKRGGLRIPDDIAFVGFNNDPVSTVLDPNLTTVNYPGYEMGVVAARNLIHHLNGTSSLESTNTILLKSELIVRASSTKM